ncbi:MAG TPA: ATP synthase F1 subunit epsilon [Geminicoccaceae bacterium]|nr:ATP synthase F1 subunit epsilon [Geminicoccaceae bacterium]HZA66953.1 ATP synthase F1 subunit epsilon [Geminicoccaceae bacterium]
MADGAETRVAFQLVAPERLLASAEVDMVVAPGAEGDFGVLPQHSLFMSVLRPGVLETYQGGQVSERIFVGGGFAEVNERGCTVLAEEAMPVAEIDLEQARRRLANAQDDLREARDDAARARCEREVKIAEAQIQAAGG